MAAVHMCVFPTSDSPIAHGGCSCKQAERKELGKREREYLRVVGKGVTLSVVFPVLSRDRLRSASHSVQCENVS